MPHGSNGGRTANPLAHSHLQKRAETPCKTAHTAMPNGPGHMEACQLQRYKKSLPHERTGPNNYQKSNYKVRQIFEMMPQLGAFDKRGNHADGLAIGHLLLYLQYGIKHRRLPVEHKSVGICNVLLCLCV